MDIPKYLISIGCPNDINVLSPEFLLYDSTSKILRRHACSSVIWDFKPIQNPSIKLLIKLTRLGMITTVG